FLIYLEPDCPDREVGIDGDMADQVVYRERPMRLVADLNALKEKIFIFEAGLDDRVMELFKMLTLTKLHGDNPDQVPDVLLFTKVDEDEDGKKIFLAAFRDNKYLGIVELPYSLYQTCVVTGEPIWDTPVTECAAIDQEWIADRLKSGGVEQCSCDTEEDEHTCECDHDRN
ncbi:MAG TPA: CpXC domain-containing protein, partial [Methanocorpusculum sp.]|nr:CpXC domain-containing protein [Methanocorpusculum sp.]